MIGQAPWQRSAREARKLVVTERHGAREAKLKDIANRFGWSDQNTLRRAISCLDFLESVKKVHSSEYQLLGRAPLSVVEVFSRWFSFDPPGALQAVRDWGEKGISVRELTKRMQDARPAELQSKKTLLLEKEQSRRSALIRDAVLEITGPELSDASFDHKEGFDIPPIDYHYLRVPPTGSTESVAVSIVGPYGIEKLYRKRRHDWILRAYGWAWLYDWVFLVVPNKETCLMYQESIDRFQRSISVRGRRSENNELKKSAPRVQVLTLQFETNKGH